MVNGRAATPPELLRPFGLLLTGAGMVLIAVTLPTVVALVASGTTWEKMAPWSPRKGVPHFTSSRAARLPPLQLSNVLELPGDLRRRRGPLLRDPSRSHHRR